MRNRDIACGSVTRRTSLRAAAALAAVTPPARGRGCCRRCRRAWRWTARVAAAAAGLATLAPPASGDLIYQSGTPGSPAQSGGITVNATTLLGVRFEVTDPVTADRMGAHLGTAFPPSNPVRGALVQLSGPSDFPDSLDVLSGGDVLATTTLTVPYGSNDVVSTFDPTPLAGGWYALVYFGQNPEFEASCYAPTNNPQVGTPSYFYRNNPGNWTNNGNSGMRFFVASSSPKFWQESSGGSWHSYVNWAPGGAPESFDDAVFDIGALGGGSGATYTVTFSADAAVHDLTNVSDHVTLSLGGRTLLNTGTITVGAAAGPAVSLDVQNGTLSRPTNHDIVLGVDGPGNMTLSNNALIDGYLLSGLVIGKDNPGALTVANAQVFTATARVADDEFVNAGAVTGGSGTVIVNGGALWNVRQSFFAGRNGPAVVELNAGGQLYVTATTKIFNSSGTEFRLQGGGLQTGSIDTSGNPSRFIWTSGTLTTTAPLTLSSSGPLGSGLPLNTGMTYFCTGGLNIAAGAGLGMNGGALTGPVTNDGSIIQLSGTTTITGSNGLTGAGTLSDSGGTFVAARIQQQSLSMGGNGLIRLSVDSGAANSTSRLGTIEILSGQLDLRDKKLVVNSTAVGIWNGSNYDGISGYIRSGRNGGSWDGSGIITSMPAASAPNHLATLAVARAGDIGKTTFGGLSVSVSDVLVMYTYTGDANLDGRVNADDYFQIDSNYNKPQASVGYFKGDFNYDGIINGDDYLLIDASFSGQGSPFSSANGAGGVMAVPEPAAVGVTTLMCIVGAATARRRCAR